jgi:hypothetical protein
MSQMHGHSIEYSGADSRIKNGSRQIRRKSAKPPDLGAGRSGNQDRMSHSHRVADVAAFILGFDHDQGGGELVLLAEGFGLGHTFEFPGKGCIVVPIHSIEKDPSDGILHKNTHNAIEVKGFPRMAQGKNAQ